MTKRPGQGVGALALYVHIPFCETRCPYCDFNTYSGIESLMPSYTDALCTETVQWGERLGHPEVRTVFFGGGTPSYLPTEHIGRLLDTIRERFAVAAEAEITLEANPGDLSRPRLAEYRGYGVNRLSIGVQSFDDGLLELLGRRHSAAQAEQAYRDAGDAGFDNVSIDLMYGLPRQTKDQWRRTLDVACNLGPPHVSMYCLTLEDGTPMERWVREGEMPEPDADLAADMYLMAQEAMNERGYSHYEISNWAREGRESRHNLVYWRNEPYLGVGPGAHSFMAGLRFYNLKSPREYGSRLRKADGIEALSRPLDADAIREVPVVESVEPIDRTLEMAETMMMGLRLDEGIGVGAFAERFGESPQQVYGDMLADLESLGLMHTLNGALRLTARGRMMGNEVFSRFFA